jgi:hypothetical protein
MPGEQLVLISEEVNMNRFFLISLAFLVLASSAFATGTTCPTGPLTAYLVPSFSCTTNSLTFTGWGYSNLNVPAALITVTPQTVSGNEGFQFNSGWNVNNAAGGGEMTEDSLISFTAAGPGITNLELFFNGSVTGTGSANVTENYCLGAPLTSCPKGSAGQIKVTNPPPGFNDQVFFSPVGSISVSKDILVDTGEGTGSAMISQVTNNFSSPEPLSFVLLGSGLLGLGLMRKRIKR